MVVLLGLTIAGTTGLGSLLLLGTAAIVALDALVAVQSTKRVRLTARAHPNDVVVGDRFIVEMTAAGPALPLRLRPPSQPAHGAMLVEPPASGTLAGRADNRGVLNHLSFATDSSGLCGLLSCSRIHEIRLARPVEVGPRPVVPAQPFPDLGGGWGEGAAAAAADGELVRGLRDYVPGDRLRQVHWRATAHTGELVVKETEEPQAPVLHVTLDLGAGGERGEEAAGRAAWYAGEALRRGYQVTLTTVEDGYPLTDATPSMVLVNRRLARAGAGAPPRPKGVARGVRVLAVSDEGDSWL